MELIGIFALALLGIFGAAISRQLTDEFNAWMPWLINYLIQRAVRQLPKDQQKRCDEEWRSHTNEIPGEVGKLINAFGCLWASWKISRDLADDLSYLIAKRAIDVVFTVLASPQLFVFAAMTAVAIWLDSDGPIIVHEERQGHKNNSLRLFKFRVSEHRRRLLPKGIEGVPMALNVLRGEMALIGPRPLRPYEIKMIDEQIPQYSRRKKSKPGLLGWAMVNGFCGQTEPTLEELQRELEDDLYYIDHRSLWFDLRIYCQYVWQGLFKTY